jgi:NAD(P)-dependent dehydrogenase (short-subunit alcohol dehydrogenase family)
MSTLDGKTALVTGASGGIGRAIAIRLAKAGARVAVHYGSGEERARETVTSIGAVGGRGFAVGADLRDTSAIAALLATLAGQGCDPLDILVNNAGVGSSGSLAETSEPEFDRLFDTNVRGPFFLTQAALPRLRDGGAIVNISSMVSIVAYPSCIAYALSKAALNSFTRSLAAELGPRRIRVNAVAPGATETAFIAAFLQNQTVVAALEGATALGRIGTPDDIAAVVEFLVSPGGAWVTGQILQASGGMHL